MAWGVPFFAERTDASEAQYSLRFPRTVSFRRAHGARGNPSSLSMRFRKKRLFHHVGVDPDGILDATRVAAGEKAEDGNPLLSACAQDQPVPAPQVLARQPEPPQLIFL